MMADQTIRGEYSKIGHQRPIVNLVVRFCCRCLTRFHLLSALIRLIRLIRVLFPSSLRKPA
jgi:hypothetical protein